MWFCRYFQASEMPKRTLVYRVNSALLLLIYISTHILSVLIVLYRHCREQHISWHLVISR